MKKRIAIAAIVSTLLFLSGIASADTVSQVWTCKLKDGATQEDAQAVNARWLKRARELTGSDAITSTYVNTTVGDTDGFLWVDSFPDFGTWGKLMDADEDEELDAAFEALQTCSGNRLYQGEETEAAK